MEFIVIIISLILLLINAMIYLNLQKLKSNLNKDNFIKEELEQSYEKSQKNMLNFIGEQMKLQSNMQKSTQEQLADIETKRFREFSESTQLSIQTLRRTVVDSSDSIDKRFETFQKANETQLNQIRETLEKKVSDMQQSNEKKLEEMRATVDEKLQKTLEERIGQSFKLVNERLEQVYTSLGEMKQLSSGVDDLKKVLSNVKTRGILGEVQLGAILEQILSNEQYDVNAITKKGSQNRVEFAVKMPGEGTSFVYLPIDSKFPLDAYQNLLDAYDTSIQENVDKAAKVLTDRIKSFAKDIRDKYIDVPYTTDFAIMFLPTEGLYAEVVRRGMIEELQKLKINIAGPTTMAALLNSLQMGFKTLAIQKRSSEVWDILAGTKQEFEKFETILAQTQKKMQLISTDLDTLIGTRTRAINRKLRDVSYIEMDEEVRNIEE